MTNTSAETTRPSVPRLAAAFDGGGIIGALGGLIGLGGAEFRLPLLIGAFRFAALEAVIMNKAMSLVVVATALSFRMTTVPLSEVALTGPLSSTCLWAALRAHGSAQGGRQGSSRKRSTA